MDGKKLGTWYGQVGDWYWTVKGYELEGGEQKWPWEIRRWGKRVEEGSEALYKLSMAKMQSRFAEVSIQQSMDATERAKLRQSIKAYERGRVCVTISVLRKLSGHPASPEDVFSWVPTWHSSATKGWQSPGAKLHHLSLSNEKAAERLEVVYTKLGVVGKKAEQYMSTMFGPWTVKPTEARVYWEDSQNMKAGKYAVP